jgi:16S rRNA (uracil1498-N3)-methyltransferase
VSPPVFIVDRATIDSGDRLVLGGSEGHHAAAVLRVRPGEALDVTDGEGRVAHCLVTSVHRDEVELDVLSRHVWPAAQPRLVIVQAIPKGDRGELAVALMTEIGVDVIVPWAARRCVVQWPKDRAAKALARWRSAARESSKQSRRWWVPEITDVETTDLVVDRLRSAACPIVLAPQGPARLFDVDVPDRGDVVVVIGPEGGLDPEELDRFRVAGAGEYRMGPSVLRTSTAGVAAASVLSARSARWA